MILQSEARSPGQMKRLEAPSNSSHNLMGPSPTPYSLLSVMIFIVSINNKGNPCLMSHLALIKHVKADMILSPATQTSEEDNYTL
jgi:hypothetical protein